METSKRQRIGDWPLIDGLGELYLTPLPSKPSTSVQRSHKPPPTTELGETCPAIEISTKLPSPSYSTATSSSHDSVVNTDGVDEQDQADEDDEDDYRRWSVNPERPRKISEKKRQDHAKFQSWIESNQAKVLEAASKTKPPTHGSVAYLVKESENRRIIQTPREYQIELFERAKQKNIIAVLDTGTGKTLIAALLLRHILEKEVEDRALGKLKRTAFFLVSPSGPPVRDCPRLTYLCRLTRCLWSFSSTRSSSATWSILSPGTVATWLMRCGQASSGPNSLKRTWS